MQLQCNYANTLLLRQSKCRNLVQNCNKMSNLTLVLLSKCNPNIKKSQKYKIQLKNLFLDQRPVIFGVVWFCIILMKNEEIWFDLMHQCNKNMEAFGYSSDLLFYSVTNLSYCKNVMSECICFCGRDLSYNFFNGSIPESLGQLTSLQIL